MDLLERIESWSRLTPDRLAHVTPGGRLSYAELTRGSDAVAGFIQRTLADDRSPVVVVGHKEPEMLLGFLGSVKTGHPYVPLDISLPPHRVERVIEIAGARLVLTVDAIRGAVATESERTKPARCLQDQDPYYVMFTSGSTGEPKGVVITVGCLTSFVDWMLAEQRFERAAEVFLNQAPFSFDLSVMDTYLSLVSGGTLVSLTSSEIAEPRRMFHSLAASGITTWVSTPSFAQLCLAERSFTGGMLPSLRRFLFCGETLPPVVAAELLERFPGAEVWNTYGPTETTVATTSMRIDQGVLERYPSLPVGRAKPDSRVTIIDGDGGRGEIVISGPNVSPGYFNRPDLTERSFFQLDGMRGYRTGDWGHLEDGLLFFDGRIDNQVKLHGYRIELGDVEANLRALPEVADAVVVPLYRGEQIDALGAFVLVEGIAGESEFETGVRLRRTLAERLPTYMVPRVVRVVDRFPITPNGKIDRRALAERIA